jgi:uncharacterized protein (DUF1684 family)
VGCKETRIANPTQSVTLLIAARSSRNRLKRLIEVSSRVETAGFIQRRLQKSLSMIECNRANNRSLRIWPKDPSLRVCKRHNDYWIDSSASTVFMEL